MEEMKEMKEEIKEKIKEKIKENFKKAVLNDFISKANINVNIDKLNAIFYELENKNKLKIIEKLWSKIENVFDVFNNYIGNYEKIIYENKKYSFIASNNIYLTLFIKMLKNDTKNLKEMTNFLKIDRIKLLDIIDLFIIGAKLLIVYDKNKNDYLAKKIMYDLNDGNIILFSRTEYYNNFKKNYFTLINNYIPIEKILENDYKEKYEILNILRKKFLFNKNSELAKIFKNQIYINKNYNENKEKLLNKIYETIYSTHIYLNTNFEGEKENIICDIINPKLADYLDIIYGIKRKIKHQCFLCEQNKNVSFGFFCDNCYNFSYKIFMMDNEIKNIISI